MKKMMNMLFIILIVFSTSCSCFPLGKQEQNWNTDYGPEITMDKVFEIQPTFGNYLGDHFIYQDFLYYQDSNYDFVKYDVINKNELWRIDLDGDVDGSPTFWVADGEDIYMISPSMDNTQAYMHWLKTDGSFYRRINFPDSHKQIGNGEITVHNGLIYLPEDFVGVHVFDPLNDVTIENGVYTAHTTVVIPVKRSTDLVRIVPKFWNNYLIEVFKETLDTYQSHLEAYDMTDGFHEVWSMIMPGEQNGGADGDKLQIYDNRIFVTQPKGYCVDPATGVILWSIEGMVGGWNTGMTFSEGNVYITNTMATDHIEDPRWIVPTIDCVRQSDGQRLWGKYYAVCSLGVRPVVYNGVCYIETPDRLIALDAYTGKGLGQDTSKYGIPVQMDYRGGWSIGDIWIYKDVSGPKQAITGVRMNVKRK